MMYTKQKHQAGFSLIEVLLSVTLFGIIAVGLLSGILAGQESNVLAGNRMRAVLLAQGGLEIVRNIKDNDFARLADKTDGVAYLDSSTGTWTLDGAGVEIFTDQFFEREIELEEINSDVVEVTSRVRWQQNHRRTGMVELVTRFANWLESLWMQTTESDFDEGSENSVQVLNTAGGEVGLAFEGAWDEPGVVYAWDMTGSHDARAMVRHENELWVARSTNPASEELYVVSLADIDAVGDRNLPVIEDAFEVGFTATGLVVDPVSSRAYVSTTNNSNDVVLVDLDDTSANTIVDLEGMATTTDIAQTHDNKIVISMRNNNGGAEVHVRSASLSGVYGKVEVGAHANALAVHGDLVYVATANSQELAIVDHTDCLGEPEGYACATKWYDVPESSSELTALNIADDQLYVGRSNGYVHVIDISDPLDPTLEYSVDTGSAAINDIAPDPENGVILAATDGASTKEVIIIDLNNGDVVPVDLVGAQNADAIIRYGNLAYVSSRDNEEIQVLRGGTGGWSAPQYVNDYDVDGGTNGRAIFSAEGKTFVITGSVLSVFDVSDPTDIELLSSLDAGFTLGDVAARGDYIYLATSHNQKELIILDMSDPRNITEVPGGSFNTEGGHDGISIHVQDNQLFLGTRKNGGAHQSCQQNAEMYMIDISNPGAPSCMGSGQLGRNANDIGVASGHAYVATNKGREQIMVMDVSDPASMTVVDTYETPGSARGIFVLGDLLFVGSDDGQTADDLFVFDISTPNNLQLVAAHDTENRVNQVASDGDYIFVVSHINNAFQVFDFTQSPAISPLASYNTLGGCVDMVWDGVHAHLACDANTQEYLILGPQAAPDSYTVEGWFTSEMFDSGSPGTRWTGLSWGEGGQGSIGIQLRTAPDIGGAPGTWGHWLGTGGRETFYTNPDGSATVNTAHRDGSGDQWIQYRAYLQGGNGNTPTLEEITLQF